MHHVGTPHDRSSATTQIHFADARRRLLPPPPAHLWPSRLFLGGDPGQDSSREARWGSPLLQHKAEPTASVDAFDPASSTDRASTYETATPQGGHPAIDPTEQEARLEILCTGKRGRATSPRTGHAGARAPPSTGDAGTARQPVSRRWRPEWEASVSKAIAGSSPGLPLRDTTTMARMEPKRREPTIRSNLGDGPRWPTAPWPGPRRVGRVVLPPEWEPKRRFRGLLSPNPSGAGRRQVVRIDAVAPRRKGGV
jgi:hypothetical protein